MPVNVSPTARYLVLSGRLDLLSPKHIKFCFSSMTCGQLDEYTYTRFISYHIIYSTQHITSHDITYLQIRSDQFNTYSVEIYSYKFEYLHILSRISSLQITPIQYLQRQDITQIQHKHLQQYFSYYSIKRKERK